MKPKSGNRFRVCGTPSRTGCITCKIRRVKCGEEKPCCKRCTSTGRKCDGYAPVKPSDGSRKSPSSPVKYSPPNPNLDPAEQRLLYFFRTFTAPKLSGYFSPDFWERRVIHATDFEPAIRHAAIAIAAVHQDYIAWQQSKLYDPSIQSFAFRQYTKAISYLYQLMSTQTQHLDITLTACILFISFDCLLGNHESAIIHLKSGLKILEDIKMKKVPGGSSAHEWEREFSPLLLSLGIQAASFANPRQRVDRLALWVALKNAGLPAQPTRFYSLDEARHALDTLTADITVDRTAAADRTMDRQCPSPRSNEGHRHIAAMQAWSETFEIFLLESMPENRTMITKHDLGASLLKLHSLVFSIVIEAPEHSHKRFDEVLAHCEFLIAAKINSPFPNENLNFTATMGLIAPLFFTVMRSPSRAIQQRAIDLLSRSPGREGTWDGDDALRIAGETAEAGYYQEFENPFYSVSGSMSPQSEVGMKNFMEDRMIWPFGEKYHPELSHRASMDEVSFSLDIQPNLDWIPFPNPPVRSNTV
ncbi:Transcriptional regulatory protein [Lachnellula occidentalis]|uniref:Transcriptional regulatory protein n=1 Tax=Lachnellula occidentalis TaxID=215460 RepID=A0A8H8RNE2_9HELO|nr:Transcriptional regulatory protein [Lachnellula occidentalis]